MVVERQQLRETIRVENTGWGGNVIRTRVFGARRRRQLTEFFQFFYTNPFTTSEQEFCRTSRRNVPRKDKNLYTETKFGEDIGMGCSSLRQMLSIKKMCRMKPEALSYIQNCVRNDW